MPDKYNARTNPITIQFCLAWTLQSRHMVGQAKLSWLGLGLYGVLHLSGIDIIEFYLVTIITISKLLPQNYGFLSVTLFVIIYIIMHLVLVSKSLLCKFWNEAFNFILRIIFVELLHYRVERQFLLFFIGRNCQVLSSAQLFYTSCLFDSVIRPVISWPMQTTTKQESTIYVS